MLERVADEFREPLKSKTLSCGNLLGLIGAETMKDSLWERLRVWRLGKLWVVKSWLKHFNLVQERFKVTKCWKMGLERKSTKME